MPSLEPLREAGIVGDDTRAVFLSGSLVEGWGHPNSDLDLYVFGERARPSSVTGVRLLPLPTPEVDLVVHYEGDVRWDVECWRVAQVDELLGKVATADDPRAATSLALSYRETEILYRLSIGEPILGAAWLDAVKERIARSRLARFLAATAFNAADNLIEDTVGTLAAGDDASAVLAAQKAFGLTIDGLLYSKGHLCPNQKWRARKLADVAPAEISWEEYWAIETYAGYSRNGAAEWVEQVLRWCERIMAEVDL